MNKATYAPAVYIDGHKFWITHDKDLSLVKSFAFQTKEEAVAWAAAAFELRGLSNSLEVTIVERFLVPQEKEHKISFSGVLLCR